jgi:hypothetical protein
MLKFLNIFWIYIFRLPFVSFVNYVNQPKIIYFWTSIYVKGENKLDIYRGKMNKSLKLMLLFLKWVRFYATVKCHSNLRETLAMGVFLFTIR